MIHIKYKEYTRYSDQEQDRSCSLANLIDDSLESQDRFNKNDLSKCQEKINNLTILVAFLVEKLIKRGDMSIDDLKDAMPNLRGTDHQLDSEW